MHDETLVQNTIRKCIRKLRGTHGFKRYLRDGQYTDLESKDQRFYESTEIKVHRCFEEHRPQIENFVSV